MEQVEVSERIDVLASFKKGGIKPVIFKWNGRNIKIDSINLKYSYSYGDVDYHCFSVSAGDTAYRICLNGKTLVWRLEEVFS